MLARDESLLHAIDVVGARSSLDIIGDNGSGRSFLLDRIGEYFEGRGLNIIRVEGFPAFAGTPLAALGWLSVSMTSLQAAYNDVVALVGDRGAIILVDNWDSVDEMSWGVLTRVRKHTGTPIVTTRLSGTGAKGAFSDTGFGHTFQMRLLPLRLKELERALTKENGVRIEQRTMAELYATTGGNLGLARAVYESALRGGRLRVEDDTVRAHGELWTTSMSTILETILRPLSPELRAHLETLAYLGPAPLTTATAAIGRESIERLADSGFVEVFSAGGAAVVAVRQPLVVSYFRHETSNVRRLLIADDLQELKAARALPTTADDDEYTGLFVVLVHEYERRRLEEARQAWDAHRSRDTAADLLAVLGRTSNAGAEIPTIIRESEDLSGTPAGVLAWDIWNASYTALVHGDPAAAADMLERRAEQTPENAGPLRLRSALIHTMLVGPIDAAALPRPELFPPDDAWEVEQTAAYVALTAGDVERALEIALPLRDAHANSLLDLVAVVALTADGQYAAARAISRAGVQAAAAAFDPGELYRYVYMGALSSFIAGRHAEAEDIIGIVSQLAGPVDEGLTHLGIQAIATSIAARRGGVVADAPKDTVVGVQGAFPGMQREWIDAEELRAQGDPAAAADLLSAVGDGLWDRGFRLAAAYAYLAATGADLHPKRLTSLTERVSAVGGRGIAAHRDLLIARVTRDLDAMVDAALSAERDGRWFFALLTWGEVAELAEAEGDVALAETAEVHATRLRAEVEGAGVTQTVRRLPHNLTDREREIARLAASGLANTEIGQMLFVSTRTVESHLNRVMRKAGVQTRQELRDLYRTGG